MLVKELQSLSLDVRVLDEEGGEIDLKQNFDEDNDIIPQPSSEELDTGMSYAADESLDDDYSDDADLDDYDDSDYDSDEDEITGFSTRDDESDEDLV